MHRIKDARMKFKMSQEELAYRIGTSQKQVSRYERGVNDPTAEVIIRISEVLNVSSDYILGLSDQIKCIEESNLTDIENNILSIVTKQTIENQLKVLDIIRILFPEETTPIEPDNTPPKQP